MSPKNETQSTPKGSSKSLSPKNKTQSTPLGSSKSLSPQNKTQSTPSGSSKSLSPFENQTRSTPLGSFKSLSLENQSQSTPPGFSKSLSPSKNEPRLTPSGSYKSPSYKKNPPGTTKSLSPVLETPNSSIPIHEVNSSQNKISLPHIFLRTKYAHKPLCFLIDTGSTVSILKLTNLDIKPSLSRNKIILKGLSNTDSTCETLGSLNLQFQCQTSNSNEPATFTYKFHAIDENVNLKYDGILGNDLLKELDADIQYSQNCLIIQGHSLPFYFNQPAYVIPPRSEVVIECPLSNHPSELLNITEGLILDHQISDGVFLANCFVKIKPNKRVNTSVLNTTDSEVIIRDYFVHLEPFDNVASVPIAHSYNIQQQHNSPHRDQKVLDLIRTTHLNDEEKNVLLECCSKYTDIFHLEGEPLSCTNAIKHSINTKDAAPIHVKSYRFPECHKNEVETQIKQMLDQNIIRPSMSPWSAPVWVVPKKLDASGKQKWRIVIDYRKLNDATVTEIYPLPLITDILDQLGHSKYFTTLDLASGFHQLELKAEDAPKTGFTVITNGNASGHYEFTRMPFGLKNAPSTFQKLMNTVLSGLQGLHCYVYLDDCILYSHDLVGHIEKLNLVFDRLRKFNLKLQPDKCEFLRREVAYLGHIITDKGVSPNPDKIAAVTQFPTPKNPKDIKSFLGLVGYYRRFIENFSKITKPLTSLLKKDAVFQWSHEQEQSFNLLKNKLTSAPLLQYPDFNNPFLLTTDASNYAVGAILSQGEIGKDKPIAYASRTLNKAEGNYSTIEKELLAILFGVKTFRPYLYGRKFRIITDHRPLVWLFNVKDPGSRLIRWRLKLEEYDYEIIYKQGKLNSNADALSRFPVNTLDKNSPNTDSMLCNPTQVGDNNTESHNLPSLSETYEQFLQISKQTGVSYDTVIQEHNESLLKAKCRLIAYPTSLDLDESVPYCLDIINSATSEPDIREVERELHTYFSTSNDKHVYTHLFLRINHFDEMTYKDIFNVLRDYRDMVKYWYMEENEFAISDFTDPFSKLSFTKIYNIISFLFHNTGIKVNIYHNSIKFPTPDEVKQILKDNHDSPSAGHPGISRMLDRIKPQFWWKNMRQDIEDYVKNCRSCQINKPLRQTNRAPMIVTSTATRPNEKIFLDLVGPLPETHEHKYKFILTLQDDLTKYSQAYPMQTCSAEETAKLFVNYISHIGIPKMIVTDQGTNFCSEVFKQLEKLFGIKHIFASPYHPQTCGALERSHSTLKEYLRSYIGENQHTWDLYIPSAMIAYNSNVHSTTGFSPLELLFGYKPYIPNSIDTLDTNTYTDYIRALNHRLYYCRQKALENIQSSKEKSKTYYDSRTKPIKYNAGDMVYIRCHHKQNKALSPMWKGPFKIIKLNGNHTVTVQVNRKHIRHHYDEIKLAADHTSHVTHS